MKTRTIKHLAASALVLGMLATVQTVTAAPQGIVNSRHNLGSGDLAVGATSGTRLASSTGIGDVFTTKTDQICVFCHTPHGANTNLTSAPLWNKAIPTTATYSVYSTGTMQATAPTTAGIQASASIACLSCHDGTQAMDNVLNGPGQGMFNRAPGQYMNGNRMGQQLRDDGTTVTGSTGIWYSGGIKNVVGAQTGGASTACQDPGEPACADTTDGKLTANAGVDFIGTDLSNDHPIAIAYAGGGCGNGNNATCNDKDFVAPQAGLTSTSFQVGGATAGDKQAMRLYGADVVSATVECASCHDPHNDQFPTFLRKSNAGSAVCLTCHIK